MARCRLVSLSTKKLVKYSVVASSPRVTQKPLSHSPQRWAVCHQGRLQLRRMTFRWCNWSLATTASARRVRTLGRMLTLVSKASLKESSAKALFSFFVKERKSPFLSFFEGKEIQNFFKSRKKTELLNTINLLIFRDLVSLVNLITLISP